MNKEGWSFVGDWVLCGDCLKVESFTIEKHRCETLCSCGGDFCGCEECNKTIDQLRAGERSADRLLMVCKDLDYWTEENGIKKVEGSSHV